MGRDSSGNYTLPSGNPVVTGTIIESNWANTTMNDLAAAITDSLSRSGSGGMLVPFKVADGSVANPSYAFTNSTNSGIYRDGVTGEVCIAVNGVAIGKFKEGTGQGLTIDGNVNATTISYNGLLLVDGSVTNPSYSFQNSSTTGMYWDNGNQELSFALLGNDAIVVSAAGTHVTGTLTADSIGLTTLAVADGTALLPSFTFQNDLTTGWYYDSGTGELRATVGGVDAAQIGPGGSLNVVGALTVGSFALNNVRTDDGSAGSPSHSFTNGTSTGMYFNNSTDDLYLSRVGVNKLRAHSTGVEIFGVLSATGGISLGTALVDNGSVGSPSYSFLNDTNTGMWVTPNTSLHIALNGADKITLTAAGVEVTGAFNSTSTLSSDGVLDINNAGVSNIAGSLVVQGNITSNAQVLAGSLNINSNFEVNSSGIVTNGTWQGDAIADAYVGTLTTANKVAASALNIDGATLITPPLTDLDTFIVDVGDTGTNRKAQAGTMKSYFNPVPIHAAVTWNASGTILESYNVTSVVQGGGGAGHWVITMSSAAGSINYGLSLAVDDNGQGYGYLGADMINVIQGSRTTTVFDVYTKVKGNSGSTMQNYAYNSAVVHDFS